MSADTLAIGDWDCILTEPLRKAAPGPRWWKHHDPDLAEPGKSRSDPMNESMPAKGAGKQAQSAHILLAAIRDGERISDEQLLALVAEQPDVATRKRLVCGLAACGLIEREQASFAFYVHPDLKGA
jgi:hypothetical protein